MPSLKTLYVNNEQNIEGITVNTDDTKIPSTTEIVVRE